MIANIIRQQSNQNNKGGTKRKIHNRYTLYLPSPVVAAAVL